MLRYWYIFFLAVLVAVFALWIQWWASWDFPLTHQICGDGKAAEDCPSYNVFLYSAWRLAKATDHWSALITAIATGVIAWLTITLAKVGRQQLADTRILQRAYISVEPEGVRPFAYGSPRVLGYSAYKNVGNLTARNVKYFSGIEFSTERLRANFPIGELWPPNEAANVIPPGTKMIQASETKLTATQENAVKDNRGYIYVWGVVRYDDGFGFTRHTYFCHSYDHRSVRSVPHGDILNGEEARHHEYGNDAN